MAQFTAVLTSRSYKQVAARRNAMETAGTETTVAAGPYIEAVQDVARMLDELLPDHEWQIATDVLGRIQITVLAPVEPKSQEWPF